MEDIVLNAGPLNSITSLHTFISKGIDQLRSNYLKNKTSHVMLDLQNIEPYKINIAALTSLLCTVKKIRDFTGEPLDAITIWDPQILSFWKDIGFFDISKYYDLINFKPGMIGGFSYGKMAESSKIIYIDEVPILSEFKNTDDIINWKNEKRQVYKRKFKYKFYEIFGDLEMLSDDSEMDFVSILATTCSELVINSLLHGQEVCFFGIQRSTHRISIAICDGGMGFLNSLKKNYDYLYNLNSSIDAIIIASLMKQNEIGLFRCINDIILNNGYIIISSLDAEIRWERYLWEKAYSSFQDLNFPTKVPSHEILGNPLLGRANFNDKSKGFYRTHKTKLIGSRISFELPI